MCPDILAGKALPLTLYGEGRPQSSGLLRFVDFCMFEAAAPNPGNFETTGERRICLMAAQPKPRPDTYLAKEQLQRRERRVRRSS